MRFRHFDNLRGFCVVARHASFTRAAEALNLTKGAISHQIDALETELGFDLFRRRRSGITLTPAGERLLQAADLAFETLEREISLLRGADRDRITIGMATYFASRWLSPRLMHFITDHPRVALRIQPVVGNPDLHVHDLDMVIRWGRGDWNEPGYLIEPLLSCPAVLTANRRIGEIIERDGLRSALAGVNLLHDADGSRAWADWFACAGIPMPDNADALTIPDPNVRVQAVIDGQGIALYDELVAEEVSAGRLYQYPDVLLEAYGYYLVYPRTAPPGSALLAFRDWILREADQP